MTSLFLSKFMEKLEKVYHRLQKTKKEKREINKMIKDELASTERYQELLEEMTKLREEKKSIENEVKSGSDGDRLEELKVDIQSDQELLADIALNMYANEESVEITDENDVKWYPQFKVAFKKAN
jgi:ribosome-binding ATPase YchF (GTP1/OBG family)